MSAVILRSCAVGGGHHAGYRSASFGGSYLCPKHLRQTFEGFDPRPGHPVHSRVKTFDGDTDWCVLARDGDKLTLRRLGFPDSPVTVLPVSATRPAGYNFAAITRGCGQ